MRILGLSVAVALVASTAMGQVTNGTFDGGLTGWTETGGVGLLTAGLWGIPDSPSGPPSAGYVTNGGGNFNAPSATLTQTVSFSGSGTLTGEFYAGARHTDPARGATVRVFWNGALAAERHQDAAVKWAADFSWATFSVEVTGVGANELKIEFWARNAEWTFTGVDNLAVSAQICANPVAITSVTPNTFTSPPAPGSQDLTIAGENLDVVDSAKLVQGATVIGPVLPPFVSQSATELIVNFNLPESPLGAYDLVLTRPASGICQTTITEFGAVTIQCASPNIDVATVQNDRGLQGNSAHQVRITGNNVTSLDAVTLRKSNKNDYTGSAIAGTIVGPDGNDLLVNFDLTGAQAGRYDVEYTLNDPCATVSPAAHQKAFLVYMPDLSNASFEEGYKTPDPDPVTCPGDSPSNPAPKHWDHAGYNNGSFERDGHVFGPDCVGGEIQNITGAHYAGFSAFGIQQVQTKTIFQTIAAPDVSTAPFNIRAELAANGGNTTDPVTVKIRLIDGTENDVEQEWTSADLTFNNDIMNGGLHTNPDYNAVIPAGTTFLTDPPILTIVFEFTTSGGGINNYYGFWIDNVRTGPYVPVGCAARIVWADNNDDQAVDMLDFGDLQACLTQGSETPEIAAGCECFDRNSDSQLTDADVTEFIKCATGPGITWSAAVVPTCVP